MDSGNFSVSLLEVLRVGWLIVFLAARMGGYLAPRGRIPGLSACPSTVPRQSWGSELPLGITWRISLPCVMDFVLSSLLALRNPPCTSNWIKIQRGPNWQSRVIHFSDIHYWFRIGHVYQVYISANPLFTLRVAWVFLFLAAPVNKNTLPWVRGIPGLFQGSPAAILGFRTSPRYHVENSPALHDEIHLVLHPRVNESSFPISSREAISLPYPGVEKSSPDT